MIGFGGDNMLVKSFRNAPGWISRKEGGKKKNKKKTPPQVIKINIKKKRNKKDRPAGISDSCRFYGGLWW